MEIAGHAQNRLGIRLAEHHRPGQSRQHRTQIKSAVEAVGRFRQVQARILALPDRVVAAALRPLPKAKVKHAPTFDARQALANWAGADLTRIDGLGVSAAMKLLAEITRRKT